jgi:hypothetical protein
MQAFTYRHRRIVVGTLCSIMVLLSALWLLRATPAHATSLGGVAPFRISTPTPKTPTQTNRNQQQQAHAQTPQSPTTACHAVPTDSALLAANPSETPLTAPTDANQIGLDPSSWITIELRYCPLYNSFFGRFKFRSPENQPVLVTCDIDSRGIQQVDSTSNPYPYSTPPHDKQDGCQDKNGNPITLSDGDSVDTPLTITDGNVWRACLSDIDMQTGQTDKTVCTDYALAGGIRDAGSPPS